MTLLHWFPWRVCYRSLCSLSSSLALGERCLANIYKSTRRLMLPGILVLFITAINVGNAINNVIILDKEVLGI